MKKINKILITFISTLLILTPIFYFIIKPIHTDIKIKLESWDIQRISQDITLGYFTTVSPDHVKKEVLGTSTIEEYIENIQLNEKVLEEQNTKILIEDIDVEGKVVQGESSHTMDEGFWHFPLSALPGEQGNMVIIGHRFQYLPPQKNTFYNLDKLKIGDEINIVQDNGQYTYIVVDTDVVESNDISILQETDDYRLTLVTCTPLWTSEKRLVITAKLDKLYKKV